VRGSALYGAIVVLCSSAAFADDSAPITGDKVAPDPDYSFCTTCHGAQGNGNRAINAPKIAGIEPWYLKRQLELFREGARGTSPSDEPGMEMQPVGMQLDDAAIDSVVAYVARFDPKQPPLTVRGDTKRGRALYASCAGCHGERAEGNAALRAPALAGQTDWYLVAQLQRFRTGERGFALNDEPGTQMRAAATVLPDSSAIEDVIAYVNTLTARGRGQPPGKTASSERGNR
jgi:cytochrome c oxidase subunit 2